MFGPRRIEARERWFGLPGRFTYAACAACGSLCLTEAPTDLAAYYPDAYYSFATDRGSGLLAGLRRAALRYSVTGRGAAGRLAAWLFPPTDPALHRRLARAGVAPPARVLDVGCGGGTLLAAMSAAGYTELTGVDPFLASDRDLGAVRLRKTTVEQLVGQFDFVMLHHSLEHVPDPAATLAGVRRVLRPGGHCLVRVPIVPSAAWERYGANWVQLDAPRHLTIPSEVGLSTLAARLGFLLVESEHDSLPIQFWGSELYERGITLAAGTASMTWLSKRRGRRRARRLNVARRGDQAAFVFRAE